MHNAEQSVSLLWHLKISEWTSISDNRSTKIDSRQKSPLKQTKSASKLPVKSTYLSAIPNKQQQSHSAGDKPMSNNTLSAPQQPLNKPDIQEFSNIQEYKLLSSLVYKSTISSISSQIWRMVQRFRFSKPVIREKRETPAFWWNQSSDLGTWACRETKKKVPGYCILCFCEESLESYQDENDGKHSLDPQNARESTMVCFKPRNDNVNKFLLIEFFKTTSKIFSENLKQLDMKTHSLIDKSESTLNDKFVSSEGVGSSTTTLNTESTYNRNSERYSNEFTYKPEFVKYLQSKQLLSWFTRYG